MLRTSPRGTIAGATDDAAAGGITGLPTAEGGGGGGGGVGRTEGAGPPCLPGMRSFVSLAAVSSRRP